MRKLSAALMPLTALAVLACAAGTATGARHATAARPCAKSRLTGAYTASVRHALRAGKDLWGNALMHAPGGPTYTGVARRLTPLLLAAGNRHRYLTESGIHYLPFGWPTSFGVHNVALHVADGSGIFANRTRGPRLTVTVGRQARERYGRCLARLSTPALARGYLPILETRYADASGGYYSEESFSGLLPETQSLVSFVRLSADATEAGRTLTIRFRPSARGLTMSDSGSLVRGTKTFLYASEGGSFDGSSLTYEIPPGSRATVYVAWPVAPATGRPFVLDEAGYERARQAVVDFWTAKLAQGAVYEVPEKRVEDAARNLLIQNLTLAWRYSVGDDYHNKLSTPEAIDAAGVMGEYGFAETNRSILDVSFWRPFGEAANWKIGEQLLGSARYYALFHDRAFLAARTPKLARYVAHVRRQLLGRSLLRRERYSSDVDIAVFGLHSQAVVWAGLRAMSAVWASAGYRALAARAGAVAGRLGSGLRRGIQRSARRLPDGSLFVPVRLVDGERPYRRLTASKPGSFWNLVMPYALASGILPPHSATARGVLRYMLSHGSRLLGLVRASAFTLYGQKRFPTSGTDQVYGLNVARFLADNDRPDQLVLSLYGQLAAGMTPGTYVSGEAATIAPVRGEYYRRMYLPPNSGSNSTFLETLRLMLVHETRKKGGAANGLELAFATPRSWLRPGREITVTNAPTSFGTLFYSLSARAGAVDAVLEVPPSRSLSKLRLRLRLPAGRHLTSVVLEGHAYRSFDSTTGTIDLSGHTGNLVLVARFG